MSYKHLLPKTLQRDELKAVNRNAPDGICPQTEIEKPDNLNLNGILVEARFEDGYINATQLCKAGKKRFSNWYRLDSTKELIKTLEEIKGKGKPLVETSKSKYLGSWIHPDLAGQLAQWLSPIFAIQVSQWLRELAVIGQIIYLQKELIKQKEQNKKLQNNILIFMSM